MSKKKFKIKCQNCSACYSIDYEIFGKDFIGLKMDLEECPLCYTKESGE